MKIEEYTARWHSDVIRLAGEVFGPGYFDRPWEIAIDPETVILVSHEDDDVLLGFAQGRLLPPGGFQAHLEHRVTEIPPEIAEADAKGALGAVEAIAVAAEHRRRGIGRKLLEALHDDLVGLGADKLIVTFKRGPSADPVDGIMSRLGFQRWTRLPSFWQQRCESGEFQCVDRHNGCSCEAMLYRKEIY
jgi:GNAT superfamily N-acetyltransferase